MKCNNICIIDVWEGEEAEQMFEEIMAEKFPNLMKETVTQV